MIKNNQFYILRHGKTKYQTSLKHRIYPFKGSLNSIGLVREGKEKIKKSALKIKKKKIDFIYSSDFLRTKQTSLIVGRFLEIPKNRIFFNKNLRDINLGVYHGKSKKKWKKDTDNGKKYYNKPYIKPLKGESIKETSERIFNFVKKIDKKYKSKNILIVGHGDPLWLLERRVKGKKINNLFNEKKAEKNYIQPGEWRKIS